jgi:hypothetical protein
MFEKHGFFDMRKAMLRLFPWQRRWSLADQQECYEAVF